MRHEFESGDTLISDWFDFFFFSSDQVYGHGRGRHPLLELLLLHVEFSKTQVRCVHVILRRRRYGSGEWPGGGAAGGAVGGGGAASGLGPVDRARN